MNTTKKILGEDFKRAWPPCGVEARGERRLTLIKMDEAVRKKIDQLFK